MLLLMTAPSTVNVLPHWLYLLYQFGCDTIPHRILCISIPPVSDDDTPDNHLPVSGSSVTSAVTLSYQMIEDYQASSSTRNLNSPAVSLLTPELLPLAFESFITAPTESSEVFLIADGNTS